MERRRGPRQKRRVTCEIETEAGRHRGIVLDVAPRGLFVQTDATLDLGARAQLCLRVDGEEIGLETRVARKRVVPRQLASVASGGLGLRIEGAPESYFRLLGSDFRAEAPASEPIVPPAPSPSSPVFRVRVKQTHGPRSRSLLVNAATEERAREEATEDLGEGWSVLEVAPA